MQRLITNVRNVCCPAKLYRNLTVQPCLTDAQSNAVFITAHSAFAQQVRIVERLLSNKFNSSLHFSSQFRLLQSFLRKPQSQVFEHASALLPVELQRQLESARQTGSRKRSPSVFRITLLLAEELITVDWLNSHSNRKYVKAYTRTNTFTTDARANIAPKNPPAPPVPKIAIRIKPFTHEKAALTARLHQRERAARTLEGIKRHEAHAPERPVQGELLSRSREPTIPNFVFYIHIL